MSERERLINELARIAGMDTIKLADWVIANRRWILKPLMGKFLHDKNCAGCIRFAMRINEAISLADLDKENLNEISDMIKLSAGKALKDMGLDFNKPDNWPKKVTLFYLNFYEDLMERMRGAK